MLTAVLPIQAVRAQASDSPPPAVDARGCSTLWTVTALPAVDGTSAPSLRVQLRFDGGRRSQTGLHLPGGWTGLAEIDDPSGPRLRPVPNEPAWRSVAHAPGEPVLLQWRLQPAVGGGGALGHALFGPGWFAFSGLGVLPLPEGSDDAGPACVVLQGATNASPSLGGTAADTRWASSHGLVDGPAALWRLPPSPLPLAQRVQQAVFAGGALQSASAAGVVAVLPRTAPWPLDAAALAAAGSRALAVQQRQWPMPATIRDATGREARAPADARDTAPWLLMALPGPAASASAVAMPANAAGGAPVAAAAPPVTSSASGAWHQALVLQLAPGWSGDDIALQRLLAPALARAWLSDRFGPMAHAGRGDTALRAWFSEGWADFLAHRSLLREGWWTPEDYAAALRAQAAAYVADPARNLSNAQLAQLTQAAKALPDPAAAAAASAQLARLQSLRGEWLALHWHQALRRAGQPGLEAALRLNLLPTALARHEGPMSAPLATHRVLASLRGVLQEQPLHELQRHIDQGQPFTLGPDSLGPCFTAPPAQPGDAPAWRPVANPLQQADCQGWLGVGPLVDMQPVARTRAAAGSDCTQATARAKRGKPAARAATRCRTPDAAGAAPTTGRAATRATGKPAGKQTAKPAARTSSAKAAAKPAKTPSAKPRAAAPSR